MRLDHGRGVYDDAPLTSESIVSHDYSMPDTGVARATSDVLWTSGVQRLVGCHPATDRIVGW